MSGGNEALINIIENLGKEFRKLLTFLETQKKDKQGIETHISALKKCSYAQSVANEVLEIKSNWEIICEVTEAACTIVTELQSSLVKEKEVTDNKTHSPNPGSKDNFDSSIECIYEDVKPLIKFEVETNHSSENTMSDIKENGNTTPSDVEVKTENTEQSAEIPKDTNEKKKGSIRLVPLQKLLSTAGANSPICEVTISDSDCDSDKGSTCLRSNQDQIFELSDSEGEPLQCDKKNEKSTEKPRKKFTPVRSSSSSQNFLQKDQPKNPLNITKTPIEINASQSELSESKSSENNVGEQDDSASNIETSSKNASKKSNEERTTNSEVESEHEPSASPASSSIGESSKINKNAHQNVLKEIHNSFQKRCMVRIKRTSLHTANNNKLDQAKQDIKPSGRSAKNSKKAVKHSKSMNSDSESDIESPEKLNNDSNDDGNSSSESEIVITRKKRIFQEKPKASSDSSSSEKNKKSKHGVVVRKKRKIISKSNSSSGDASNGNGSDDDDDDDKNRKRKKIRKLINEKNLEDGTKKATKEEEERKKRIEERQKMYNQIYMKPENVEVDELILDFDESTKKPLLKVDDGLLKKLKPHQVNGIKFMWDACFETIKDCQEKPGSGCILAHCMGLGKTMQIVTLAHTLLTNFEVTQVERVLIISPLSTLNNWAREFHHWMNFAKEKDVEVYDMSKFKDKNTRVFKLNEWFTEGGVCIVGYDMYRILSNEKTKGLRKKQKESLQKSLVDPGPDVVVCDEGHLLKNEKTSLSQAVTKMRTKRRIVLTGTPLQNNLKEYYCMIQFIKPNLLGTYKEYLNRFVNPITNGQYTDSTERDIRLMKHRSHILHKMLEACIQRRDYSVLAPYLPPKHEYVVFLTLSEVQKQLYLYYMTTQREIIGEASGNPGKGAKLFQDFQDLRRIWTHPMNLRMNSDTVIRKKMARYDSEESIKDFIDDNSEESSMSDSDSSSVVEADVCKTRSRNTRATGEASDNDSDVAEITTKDDPSEWWVKFVNETELNNIYHSPKLVLLMTLLQRCEEIGDKVLVFSQSLQSLDVIEHFLSMIDRKTRGEEIDGNVGDFKGYWRPGVNYFRLDGSRTVENRESMCKSFNNVSNLSARLFLISTRAGGLGINLVAANRVVIFDVSWNPSHDTQSIFRVYRFGQTKPCYIYRLIGLGTMEQKVYERQVAKQATAKRVIDEQQISRHYNQSDLQELYSYELETTTPREIPILPKDRLFAELLSNHEKLIFKYHEHDSLLENEDSENLTEEERKAAWDEYEAEKTRPAQPAMQYMSYDRQAFLNHYGTPSGSVTSNKIFGFRSDILLRLLNMKGSQDHPELTSAQVIQLVPEYLQRLYFEMNNGDPTLYKELLELHKTLEAPGGMYMNPLLFANQTPAPTGVSPFGAPIGNYGQAHPGTSTLNSNEVYEVD